MFCKSVDGQEGPEITIGHSRDFLPFTEIYLSCVNDVLHHENFLIPLVANKTANEVDIFSIDDRGDFHENLQRLGVPTGATKGVAIYPENDDLLLWSEFEIHRRAIWDLAFFVAQRITEASIDDNLGTNRTLLQMSAALVLSKSYGMIYEAAAADEMMKEVLKLSLNEFSRNKPHSKTMSSRVFFIRHPIMKAMVFNALEITSALRMKTTPSIEWLTKAMKEIRTKSFSHGLQLISHGEMAV